MTNLYTHRHRWGRSRPFNDYSGFSKEIFSERVQKISIDAGFTCPNRDGLKGRGGCTFCDNKTFNPAYCLPENSITDQLNQGIQFFRHRYPAQKYLAYFQAYSNTYDVLSNLQEKYQEALSHPDVVGIVIGTRPDCLTTEIVNYLQELADGYFVSLEIGVESTSDRTLRRINRGHTFKDSVDALTLCAHSDFYTGVHLILGLPGESRKEILEHVNTLNSLPFHFLKLHQMQIIRGTALAHEYVSHPEDFLNFSIEEYLDLLIEFLERLNPDIILERFISESPREKLIAPRWGLKNYAFVALLEKEMIRRNTWQGRLFNS